MSELTAKNSFSRLGLGLFVFLISEFIVSLIVSMALLIVNEITGFDLNSTSWGTWIFDYLPMYCIALPLCLLVLRSVPASRDAGEKMTAGNFFILLLACFPIMYTGSIIGSLLSSVLSNNSLTNPVEELTSDISLLGVIILVFVGPLAEEFIFRKQLIDRSVRYGEKTAILFSALSFGLFHMNLYQFFYAFGLGLIFGYVYVRTRQLRWSLIMHCIINFMGSVVAQWANSQVDLDALQALDLETATEAELLSLGSGFAVYGAFVLLILALFVGGIVVLALNYRKIHFLPQPMEPPKEEAAKTAFVNTGFILFAALCLIMIVLFFIL